LVRTAQVKFQFFELARYPYKGHQWCLVAGQEEDGLISKLLAGEGEQRHLGAPGTIGADSLDVAQVEAS
jgi:hypothetical protein